MGHSSIGYRGVVYGFSIDSDEVLDLEEHESDERIYYDSIEEMTENINYKFYEFLIRKFGDDSVPEGYNKLILKIVYDELIANYDTNPYDHPKLIMGYDLDDFTRKPEDLSFIVDNFPTDLADVCAEFYAKFECKQDCKSSDEDSSESETEINIRENYFVKRLIFGLHGYVS